MRGFSSHWLSLREPYDTQARNQSVFNSVVSSYRYRSSPIRIIDLGCGSGAALRALAPHFSVEQRWRLFDNDRHLLACASRMSFAGVHIEPIPLDLNRELEIALERPVNLVTCFALLDLVSENWLERFASIVVMRGLPVYAALTYDGRITASPADTFDQMIVQAINDHQRKDKGFGLALGSTSAAWALRRFEALGYSVVHGTSDWMLTPNDGDIQMELLSGWALAAGQIGLAPDKVANWLDRRRELIAANQSRVRVGHTDFWAYQTSSSMRMAVAFPSTYPDPAAKRVHAHPGRTPPVVAERHAA